MERAEGTPPAARRGAWTRSRSAAAAAVVALVALAGCGGDSATGGAGDIALDWAFTPEPATAAASELEDFEWQARYRVTLTETSGNQGATVTNININIFELVDGAIGAPATAGNTTLEFETQRIEARGELALDFTSYYTLPNESQVAAIDVFIFMRDDEGFDLQIGRRLAVQ